jgi:hypothetical protein
VYSSTGLYVFVSIIIATVLTLLLDWFLSANNFRTITSWVRQYPLLGVPFIALLGWAIVGLTLHFWGHGGPEGRHMMLK